MSECQIDEKKKSNGCLWIAVVMQSTILLLILMFFIGAIALGKSFKNSAVSRNCPDDENPSMHEVWSYGSGSTKVVRIPLRGMILLNKKDDIFSASSGSALSALRSIRRAKKDPDVKAIIMDIDSGGGGITASDIIYKELEDFKSSASGRKVVSIFGDVAASGAYYIASASDHICAHPTTITGSIGVIMHSVNIKGLSEKIGIKDVTIKSGANKDIMNPMIDMTPEQTAIIQSMIDQMYERFVSIVAKGRSIPEEDVRKLADGRVFTAVEAEKKGLVDSIGYWDDAVKETSKLLDVDSVKVFRYEESFSLSSLFQTMYRWNPIQGTLDGVSHTGMMYMWNL